MVVGLHRLFPWKHIFVCWWLSLSVFQAFSSTTQRCLFCSQRLFRGITIPSYHGKSYEAFGYAGSRLQDVGRSIGFCYCKFIQCNYSAPQTQGCCTNRRFVQGFKPGPHARLASGANRSAVQYYHYTEYSGKLVVSLSLFFLVLNWDRQINAWPKNVNKATSPVQWK